MTGKPERLLALVAAGLMATAIAQPAAAADLGGAPYTPPPAYTERTPIQTWAGWYVGGHAGAAFDDSGDDDQFVGGIHLGHNWQSNAWVYGLEADGTFGDDIDYLASVRGRLGVAFNRMFVYGTGGVAFTEAERDFVSFAGVPFSGSDSETGWVVGGGAEYKLTSNLNLGVEALHYSFDADDPVNAFTSDDLDFTVVRGRLTYQFGGPTY
jgi:outer membrane immunogenic protein